MIQVCRTHMHNEALNSLVFYYTLGTRPSVLVQCIYIVSFNSHSSPDDYIITPNWGFGIGYPKIWLTVAGPYRLLCLLNLDSWPLRFGSLRIRGSSSRLGEKSGLRKARTWLNNNDLGHLTTELNVSWDPWVWTRPQRVFLLPISLKYEVKRISDPKRQWYEWEQRRNNIASPLKTRIFTCHNLRGILGVQWTSQGRGKGTVEHFVEALLYARHLHSHYFL